MAPIKVKPLLRYLRIGWTVVFGSLCLLMIGLWVRSYKWADILFTPASNGPLALSLRGKVYLGGILSITNSPQLQIKDYHLGGEAHMISIGIEATNWNLNGKPNTSYSVIPLRNDFTISLSLLLPIVALAAIAPHVSSLANHIRLELWPKQFSLRTLLIFTTLVAVMLGIIVWAVRK